MKKEDIELYDRSIRLWGKDTQMKISQTTVLVVNLTSSSTELCKDLLLSGISLLIADKELVSDKDVNGNFFLCKNDLNKRRCDVLKEKLQKMNTLIKVEAIDIKEIDDISVPIACVDISTLQREEVAHLDEIFIKKGVIAYYIDTFFDRGFFVNNLNEVKKAPEPKTVKIALEDCDIVINEEIDIGKEDAPFDFAASYTFISIKEKLKSMINKIDMNVKEKKIRKVIPHIAYALLQFETADVNCGVKKEIEDEMRGLKKEKGNKFYPTECVIGGIVSQEVVKCIAKKEAVNCNVYSYNAIKEYGDYFNI